MQSRMPRLALRSTFLFGATAVVLSAVTAARGDLIESFTPTSGYVLYKGSPDYISTNVDGSGGTGALANSPNASQNAWLVQSSPNGAGGIAEAQDGPGGWYLYSQTGNPGSGFTGTVWESNNPVSVLANTTYEFSFYLTNENNIINAIITPEINGVAVGTAVTAKGYYGDGIAGDQWQQFTFTWNSGANTTADLSLVNAQDTGLGNDFGIDTIRFDAAATPEPSAFLTAIVGTLGMIGYGLRRRMSRRTA
jgi:multisubunit Na+/H+ antiporter MnhC subunit